MQRENGAYQEDCEMREEDDEYEVEGTASTKINQEKRTL